MLFFRNFCSLSRSLNIWLLNKIRLAASLFLLCSARLGSLGSTTVAKSRVFIKTDALGDLFIFLESLTRFDLKDLEKDTILVRYPYGSIVRQMNIFSDVIEFDYHRYNRSLTYKYKTLRTLCGISAKLVISCVLTSSYLNDVSMSLCIQTNTRIALGVHASETESLGRFLMRLLFLHIGNIADKGHDVDTLYNALSLSGLVSAHQSLVNQQRSDISSMCAFELPPSLHCLRYAVLAPFASDPFREPDHLFWCELFDYAIPDFDIHLVVVGTKINSPVAERLCRMIIQRTQRQVYDMTGLLNLSELLATIRFSETIMCVDSGPYHIGAFFRKPIWCVAGGGHYTRFVNYPPEYKGNYILTSKEDECFNCDWKCTKNDSRSLARYPCLDGNFNSFVRRTR
jgi:ADP-heptose:LPS heptosyltransferase